MSTVQSDMYALDIDETISLIAAGGHLRSVLVQGHMGSGKSSILKALAAAKPTHRAFYFDCTTKDLGDITIPKLHELHGADFVRFATNEELGAHLDGPIILMIDEYGKAAPQVRNGLTRLLQERAIGSRTLHPDSIVFATTNLGGEGVGDLLMPHQRDRVTIVKMLKTSASKWLPWGINAGVDPIVLGWVRDNPHCFQSFEEVEKPSDNPMIYHPLQPRESFVTHRSMEAASDWVKQREHISSKVLTAGLIGTIGYHAATDLMAFVNLANKLPTLQSIKDTPASALVPESPAATCMVVFKALSTIDNTWVDSWFTYMARLGEEAQHVFINGIRDDKYNAARRDAVMNSGVFTKWLESHAWLFARDVK